MANITEVEQVVWKMEKKYGFSLSKEICLSLIENIERKIKEKGNNKKKDRDWFKKIVQNGMDNLDINDYIRRKAYMAFAGKIFGKRGGIKSAENRRKRKKEKEKYHNRNGKEGKLIFKTIKNQKVFLF